MNFPSNNHPAMRRCFFMAFMFANIYIGAKLSASRALSDTATTTTDDARNINNKNNNNYAGSSSNDSINVMSHETSSITRLRSKAQTPATATADDDLHYQFLFSEYYAAVTSELSERESRMMDRWLAPFASKMEDQDPSFQKQKLRLVQTMLRYLETYKRGNKKNNNHGDNNNKNDDRINNYFGSNDSNGMNDNYYPKHKGGESRNLKKKERKKKKNEKNPSPTSQPTPNPTPKSKSGKTGDDSLFPNKLKWPATDIYTTSNPITSGSTQYASTTTQFNYLKDFDLKANGETDDPLKLYRLFIISFIYSFFINNLFTYLFIYSFRHLFLSRNQHRNMARQGSQIPRQGRLPQSIKIRKTRQGRLQLSHDRVRQRHLSHFQIYF